MSKLSVACGVMLVGASSAIAQVELYAVDFPGNLYKVDQTTGAATLVGPTGMDRLNAAAADGSGTIFASRGRNPTNPADDNRLVKIDRLTGQATLIASYGLENDLRGLAFLGGVLYGTRDMGTADDLVTINTTTGAVTLVGPTGRGDVQGLTSTGSGRLFSVGVTGTGGLHEINPATGTATVINAALGAGGDVQAIEWISGTEAWIARANLRKVDLVTGVTSLVGPLGVSDVRGLAAVGGAQCYPDCNQDQVLNLADFGCFQTAFATGNMYADCNGDQVLNLADFGCFQTEFALGCP